VSLNTYANKTWYLNFSKGNALTYCDKKDYKFTNDKEFKKIKADLSRQMIEEPERNQITYLIYIIMAFGYVT